jgi:hypothetical protein
MDLLNLRQLGQGFELFRLAPSARINLYKRKHGLADCFAVEKRDGASNAAGRTKFLYPVMYRRCRQTDEFAELGIAQRRIAGEYA